MEFDIVSFEKIDIDEKNIWADGKKLIGAKILINGEALLDKIKEIELPFATAEGCAKLAGDYSHQIAESLHDKLTFDSRKYDEYVAALLTCTCLNDGCWSLCCQINETETEVTWHNFHNNHRGDWDYSELGTLHFEKKLYLKEIENLKKIVLQFR